MKEGVKNAPEMRRHLTVLAKSEVFDDSNVIDRTIKTSFPRPNQFVVTWSTLYANFDAQKLFKSVWLKRSRSGKKVYQVPRFILEQNVSETTVWCIQFAFLQRPKLLMYLPTGNLCIKEKLYNEKA